MQNRFFFSKIVHVLFTIKISVGFTTMILIIAFSAQQQPIAFFAELSNDMVNPSSGQTVVFDQILTNVGNAYNPSTGIFTAPLPGPTISMWSYPPQKTGTVLTTCTSFCSKTVGKQHTSSWTITLTIGSTPHPRQWFRL